MKVYVDKLPKSCNDCKFKVFIAYTKNGWEHSERYCSIMKESYDCSCSKERCPLKSFAEHDKQVRKQVCEEIYKKCEPLFRLVNNYDNGDVIERNELVDILEEIQGE